MLESPEELLLRYVDLVLQSLNLELIDAEEFRETRVVVGQDAPQVLKYVEGPVPGVHDGPLGGEVAEAAADLLDWDLAVLVLVEEVEDVVDVGLGRWLEAYRLKEEGQLLAWDAIVVV